MKEFKLPSGIKHAEEIGLHLIFQEIRKPGEKDFTCQILVAEHGIGINITDVYSFSSWESMKKDYPTPLLFLEDLSTNELWSGDDRIFFIESSDGHESIYDLNKTVWFYTEEPELNSDTFVETKSKAKKLK